MNTQRSSVGALFVIVVLTAMLLFTLVPVQAQETCEGSGSIGFVSWESFGVVKLQYTNSGSAPMRLTDFSIVWGNIVTRAGLVPGALTFRRVTVDGSSPADPLSTKVWEAPAGQVDTSPTNGHTEGTWQSDFVFAPGSSTAIYLDFEGTSSNLQSAFGAQVSDFDGSTFTLTPDCSGGGSSGGGSGGSGSGGSSDGGGSGGGSSDGGGSGGGSSDGGGSGGGSGSGGSGGVGDPIIIGISDNHGGSNINQERANIGFGDHFAVIFTHDGADNPALRIYRVGDNDTGWLAVAIDMDDIPTSVEENTLLVNQNGVAVYVLTSGEIQIVLGPDAEGKFYTITMNGLPFSGARYETS